MSLEKRLLLEDWIVRYIVDYSFVFCAKGASLDPAIVLNNIGKLLEGRNSPECVYLLCIKTDRGRVPDFVENSRILLYISIDN